MAAPQSIRIFRKDLLHLWPETLLVLALFIAFAAAAPSKWTTSDYAPFISILASFLKLLMPISWIILIARVIQDESLVGDRQFWTSRPYHWLSLFGAKVLYIVAFIYVPFLVMQCFLLKHAGLYPTTAVPALLHNLLLLTVVLIVPAMAIAAVTANFARLLLTLIGVVVYLLVCVGVVIWRLSSQMPPPGLWNVLFAVLILLPLGALLYQYATRRTRNSRLLLAVVPLAVIVLLLITPGAGLIRHSYPLSTGSGPTLAELPEALRPKAAGPGKPESHLGDVFLRVPFAISNLDKDSIYHIQGLSAAIDSPSVHWTSPYKLSSQELTGAAPYAAVFLSLPLKIFTQIHDQPASLHLSLATEHFTSGSSSAWKATLLPFSIPGHGVCSFSAESPDAPPTCRFPLEAPERTYANAVLTPASCSAPAAPPIPAAIGIAGNPLANVIPWPDFDPVVTLQMVYQTGDPNRQHNYVLCPGTPINFLKAESKGKVRLEVDEKNFVLDPYVMRTPPRNPVSPTPAPQPNE